MLNPEFVPRSINKLERALGRAHTFATAKFGRFHDLDLDL